MTLTIDLPPEMEARLQQEAAKRGQAPDELVRLALDALLGPPVAERPSWGAAAGMFAYPLADEDAQAWVTRTRREGDEHRERLLRRDLAPSQEEA